MYDDHAVLLIMTTALFALTVLFNFKQTWRLLKPKNSAAFSLSLSGEKTRSCFLLLLFGACVLRLASLVAFVYYPPLTDAPWIYDSLLMLPSLVFLTSFSVIALFWAQVYYTSRFMVLNHSQFLFWFLNVGVYSIVFVVAAMTHLLGASDELRIYNSLILALLNISIGSSFGWYGLKVAFQFSGNLDTRAFDARRSAVVRRVLILSTFAPLAFWIRGVYEANIGLRIVGDVWRGLSCKFWDIAMMIVSEWFPAQLVLTLFWPPKKPYRTDNSVRRKRSTTTHLPSRSQPWRTPAVCVRTC